jgi:hypothetical protein
MTPRATQARGGKRGTGPGVKRGAGRAEEPG